MLRTAHGELGLPVFLPDATRAVVRSVDSRDLVACGVGGMVVNTFHLATRPGAGLIKAAGGIHRFMRWTRPIVSDSGGFQLLSMIRGNPRYGTVSDRGIHFRNADGGGDKLKFSPQKSIQAQFGLGTDVMFCLDDCPRPDATAAENAEAARRTILWARQCRAEFDRLLAARSGAGGPRPLLFGVVQGGNDPQLRADCAGALLELGFDGYGFGGWPLDAGGNLAEEALACTARLTPAALPRFALGVGKPENVVRGWELGYSIFDCVLPTRDARRGRLYIFAGCDPATANVFAPGFYRFVYVGDRKHKRESRPVSAGCDCYCCRGYSLGYLHHLFEIRDALAWRLATMHNLRFFTQLMARLAASAQAGV